MAALIWTPEVTLVLIVATPTQPRNEAIPSRVLCIGIMHGWEDFPAKGYVMDHELLAESALYDLYRFLVKFPLYVSGFTAYLCYMLQLS